MKVILPLTKEQKVALARMINPKSVEDYGVGISVTITESEKIIDGGLDMMTIKQKLEIYFQCEACGSKITMEVAYFGQNNPLTHVKCTACGKWADTRTSTATPTAPADAEDSGRKVI